MEIVNVSIDKIKPYENNPRKNDKAVEAVMKSITDFGFKVPIVITPEFEIITGHTRYKAAKKLSLDVVPCIIAEDLTEAKAKAFRLADNKVSELSEWDFTKLNQELSEIDFDMIKFGFDMPDVALDIDTGETEDGFDVEEEIEKIKTPTAKLGDLYQLGEHRLLCGDSTNPEHIKKLMGKKGGVKIKLIFSSPPYNMASKGQNKLYENYEDNLESHEYIDFNLKVINEYKKYLDGFLFWNISYNKNSKTEFINIFYKIIHETDLQFLDLIVWDKLHAFPVTSTENLRRTYEDILVVGKLEAITHDIEFYPIMRSGKNIVYNKKTAFVLPNYWKKTNESATVGTNSACFPVELPATAMKLMTLENETVCDCFNGAGTTLIAAEKMNRKYLGMELDPVYVDLTIKRWEDFTGKKAELIG